MSHLQSDGFGEDKMNELKKLAEAQYFYNRMLAEFDNRQDFTYNLSAFLAAARSCESARICFTLLSLYVTMQCNALVK